MRYLAMLSMLCMTMLVLLGIIGMVRDEWFNWMTDIGVGYFTGSIGMSIYHEIIYKWYKKQL